MNTADFELLSGLIKERSGLVLTPDKLYLLESRLTPVARKHEIDGLTGLVANLRTRTDDKILTDVVEAMTTNESFFFRDTHMFDTFRDEVLPALIAARQATKRLRIWCAAASSGQEPYSIAMILKEMGARLAGWKIDILGTDISHDILARAKSGLYTQFEVQRGVPTMFLLTYFDRAGEQWQIKDAVRAMVEYRYFNLLDPLSMLGKFDVVFCRNVLIYFDDATKSRVLDAVAGMLPPDGVLLLGGAESVLGLCKAFESSIGQRGIYRLSGGQAAAPRAAGAPPAVKPVAAPATAPIAAQAATPLAPPATTPPARAIPATPPAAKPVTAPAAPAAPAAKPVAAPSAAPAAKPTAATAPASPATTATGSSATPARPGPGGTAVRTTIG
jgi:chemotaxis protein methyltransferase CheR